MTPDDTGIRRWDLDDDLIEEAARGEKSRVRVSRPDRITVVLGSGGKPDVELNLEACREDGVPIRRRRGGGCAVLLDPGNLVVSIARPVLGLGGVRTHFAMASAFIADALDDLGYGGVGQEGTSDLSHGDRKLGGSCIFRRKDLLYYATTLLVSPRVDLIERYIAHPPREPAYRRGRPHAQFLTSLPRIGPAREPDELRRLLAGRLTAEAFESRVRRG